MYTYIHTFHIRWLLRLLLINCNYCLFFWIFIHNWPINSNRTNKQIIIQSCGSLILFDRFCFDHIFPESISPAIITKYIRLTFHGDYLSFSFSLFSFTKVILLLIIMMIANLYPSMPFFILSLNLISTNTVIEQ